ncbi:hypothetical protein Phpb_04591 [Photorhabdus namnaonensis]|uniref:Uncharacterized protein n=1 Tax=Photorhabdus namnaonensis TaxID=1851568 RepID=A0A1B8YB54_9GAMM|nr:hypothetical protein Phpb_04591 [Photorhabdus namnaonensis]
MMDSDDLPAGVHGVNRVFVKRKDFTGHQFKTVALPAAGLTLILDGLMTTLDKRFRLCVFLKTAVAFKKLKQGFLPFDTGIDISPVCQAVSGILGIIVLINNPIRGHGDPQTHLINHIHFCGRLYLRVVDQR